MVIDWIHAINQFSSPPKNRDPYGWSETKTDALHNQTLGLFVAALSFYGKCFAQCEGRRIKLDGKWIPKGFEDTHQLILSMRNNFAAHSGADKFEDVNIVLVVAEKKGKLLDERMLVRELKQMEALISHQDDEYSFLLLSTKLRQKVLKKIDALNDKIFVEEINSRGAKFWLSQKKY